MDEFEDATRSSWLDFIRNFPIIELQARAPRRSDSASCLLRCSPLTAGMGRQTHATGSLSAARLALSGTLGHARCAQRLVHRDRRCLRALWSVRAGRRSRGRCPLSRLPKRARIMRCSRARIVLGSRASITPGSRVPFCTHGCGTCRWRAGGWTFRIQPDPPEEEWLPTKLTFRVKSTRDLYRICHKSKRGRICVPVLEFEIQADGQRCAAYHRCAVLRHRCISATDVVWSKEGSSETNNSSNLDAAAQQLSLPHHA